MKGIVAAYHIQPDSGIAEQFLSHTNMPADPHRFCKGKHHDNKEIRTIRFEEKRGNSYIV